MIATRDYRIRLSLADIIFSGVFERHSKLMVGSIEHELGWIPSFLERMDYTYTQGIYRKHWQRFKGDALPRDFFHRNVFCSFQQDAIGILERKVIGVSGLVWGSDYPHPEATFHRSRAILARILQGVPDAEAAKIASKNTARLYHISTN